MDVNTYLIKFPEARQYEAFIQGWDSNHKMTKKSRKKKATERPWELRKGFLLFTEETAFELSPPYPGNAAQFRLTDWRLYKYRPLETEKELRERLQAQYRKDVFLLRRTEEEVSCIIEDVVSKSWTVERPIRLYVDGMDDSSWTKIYATVEEAEADLALLEGCQPLDFRKDFLPLGFFFSN